MPQLTTTQALALVLMQQYLGGLLPGAATADLEPYFRMARQRLSEAATGGVGRRWLDRVRVIPPTQPLIPPKVDPAVHSVVTDSLLRGCKVEINYRKRGAEVSQRSVLNPLGFIQRGTVLYLAATFEGYADVRLLALHRISRAEALTQQATQPESFDLDQHIGEGFLDFGSGKKVVLVALFEADATIHFSESPLSKDQLLVTKANGLVQLRATVAETPQLYWWLLGFGGRVEVIKPSRLRKKVAETAKAMAERYLHRSA